MKYVKFTGKFRDLIPEGWNFCKLFARNYRQYSKTCDGEQYSQGCRIWQHLGGYLEIADLGALSVKIVEKVKDGTIDEWSSKVKSAFHNGAEHKVYWFKIDGKNDSFHPYHSQRYVEIQKEEWALPDIGDKSEMKRAAHEFYERFQSWNMRPEIVTMIKDLLDKGMIDVIEVKEDDKCPYTKYK